MAKIYAFFNPLAGNGQCWADVTLLERFYDNICYCDMTLPETYETQLFALTPEESLILCGRDATVCFDKPVTIRIDGEIIGLAESCQVCMATR